ncbi:MAG: transposase [Chloroflexota bacterium]|nr:transposase [Chloroflexota bacterium]
MKRTFKFRLYPTSAQAAALDWTLARCCELYNAALQERKEAWNACKRHPNFYDPVWRTEHAGEYSVHYYDQVNALPDLKRALRPEYATIGSHVLQDVLRRVKKTFDDFFGRVRRGQTPGYPRYQRWTHYDSFTFPDASGWKLSGHRLNITGLGSIKIKLHRPVEGTIKTTTIKREGVHWYVCFVCEVVAHPRLPVTSEAVGIDLGLLHFATLSSGQTIENPRYLRVSEKKLAEKQQVLSRKKRGSHRRKKAARLVGACHRHVRKQRQDFLHKQSRNLVNCYETIIFEDLKPRNMSRRPKPKQDAGTGEFLPNGVAAKGGLNKSIHDAGWATFVAMVRAKAESAGHVTIVLVDPHKTSQLCSGCKREGPHKDLSERTHTCPHCGLVLDRDHNAALNILRLGLSRQAA